MIIGAGPDRHRPGLRVRLFRRPGLQGAARGRLPRHPRQFQPGDDHDRSFARRRPPISSRSRRRWWKRSSSARSRTAAPDHGRADGAEHGDDSGQVRRAGASRRGADRREGTKKRRAGVRELKEGWRSCLLFQCGPGGVEHGGRRAPGGDARPDLEGLCALVGQHGKAVGGRHAQSTGLGKEGGLRGIVDHVEHGCRPGQKGQIDWGGLAGAEAALVALMMIVPAGGRAESPRACRGMPPASGRRRSRSRPRRSCVRLAIQSDWQQTVAYHEGTAAKMAVLTPLVEKDWVVSMAIPHAEILAPVRKAMGRTLLWGSPPPWWASLRRSPWAAR